MVHHLIRVLEAGGEGAAAELVAKLGGKAEIARELAYRLYTLCERKKRAAEALAYNGLVQSWPEITRLAREGGTPQPAQTATVRRRRGISHGHHQPRTRRQGAGLLKDGLRPFVERELKSTYRRPHCGSRCRTSSATTRLDAGKADRDWDVAALLR